MSDSAYHNKPPILLGIVIFTALLMLIARGAFVDEGSPLSYALSAVVYVELGAGFQSIGVHQFSDAENWDNVISMTHYALPRTLLLAEGCPKVVENGLYLEVVEGEEKSTQIQCRWMAAEHRIALRIPLHPDRMSRDDWVALPGIGEVLAQRIELDRQNNGDFGSLEALQRVSGVGPKRIAAWKNFFDLGN